MLIAGQVLKESLSAGIKLANFGFSALGRRIQTLHLSDPDSGQEAPR